MAAPALVATDLDGTIVRRDGTVSPRTAQAFRDAAQAGVIVVLVTGRPPRWLWPIHDQLDVTGLAICANGALVVDLGTREIADRHTFTPEAVLSIGSTLRQRFSSLGTPAFAIETGEMFAREAEYYSRTFAPIECPVGPLEELMADRPAVAKLLLRVDGVPADELWRLATEAVGDATVVTHTNPADCLLEIGPPGVTKATSLATLAADLGIAAQDCVAFGDMPNDIPMLQWAGAGYAMTGGHSQTLACTEHRAPRCEDDGVAQILQELLRT